jgi:hypothetical protein
MKKFWQELYYAFLLLALLLMAVFSCTVLVVSGDRNILIPEHNFDIKHRGVDLSRDSITIDTLIFKHKKTPEK